MSEQLIRIACFLAGLAVILGAFGAHSLDDLVPVDRLAYYETGIRYQFYHAIAILAAGILMNFYSSKTLKWSGMAFIAGILLFSGSLYLLAVRDLIGLSQNYKWLGPMTPIGGLCFILGWVLLFLGIKK